LEWINEDDVKHKKVSIPDMFAIESYCKVLNLPIPKYFTRLLNPFSISLNSDTSLPTQFIKIQELKECIKIQKFIPKRYLTSKKLSTWKQLPFSVKIYPDDAEFWDYVFKNLEKQVARQFKNSPRIIVVLRHLIVESLDLELIEDAQIPDLEAVKMEENAKCKNIEEIEMRPVYLEIECDEYLSFLESHFHDQTFQANDQNEELEHYEMYDEEKHGPADDVGNISDDESKEVYGQSVYSIPQPTFEKEYKPKDMKMFGLATKLFGSEVSTSSVGGKVKIKID
jgi:hypothetical protein